MADDKVSGPGVGIDLGKFVMMITFWFGLTD